MRSKVKPKRSARKPKRSPYARYIGFFNKWTAAEADKSILQAENSKLRDANQDRVLLFEEVMRQIPMLNALCRAHDRSNYMYMVAEHDFLLTVAERDALSKRNEKQAQVIEELEAENYAHKKNRTLSMMQVEKW